MTSANFKLFCNLLSENLILQTYTAFGVMVDLKNLLQGIKTDIYSELYTGNNNSSVYLELLLNEIEETDYPKKYDKVKIDQWLTKYNISLNEIFNQNIFKNQFHKVIDYDTYTGDNILVQNDKQNYHLYNDALNIQNDFLIYFKCFYANEAINFINSLKMDFKPTSNSVQKSPVFENQYLDEFCKKIQDINSLKRTGFLQYYELGILHFTDYLKEEIYKNLVSLSTQKSIAYLNFVKAKISNTNFFETPPDILESIIVQYDTKNEPFPFKDNQKIKNFISTCYNRDNLDEWQREKMCEMQHTFFEYASMVEAKKITSFVSDLLQEKPSETIVPNDMKKKSEINKNTDFESLNVYSKLLFLFEEIEQTQNRLFNEIQFNDLPEQINPESIKLEDELSILREQIPQLINELYEFSRVKNLFYFDCSSEVYKNHYEERYVVYKKEAPEAGELDFLKSEINYLSNPFQNRLLNKKHNYNKYIDYIDRYKISLRKKLEFLNPKIEKYNYRISYEEDIFIGEVGIDYKEGTKIFLNKLEKEISNQIKEEENENISNTKKTKQLTTNQIILLLERLQFFSLKELKDQPKTKQSELLSKITGLNSKNLKTSIQNLEKKPSQLKPNHQNDLDKIQDILDNLE